MYHSISIGDKNTWDDFHMVPNSRPSVSPPSVRTKYVNIPGGNGSLDLSTSLTGDVLYNNREGSWDFTVVNSMYGIQDENWEITYHRLLNFMHGQRMKIILEDDPAYYYWGRLSVDQWKSDKNYSKITINYNLEPFKYELTNSETDWLWDPFNFETGIVRDYRGITINGTKTITIPGSTKPVVPTIMAVITSGNSLSVTYEGAAYSLSAGANKIADIVLRNTTNTITFTGIGSVSIIYQGGVL